MKCQRCAGLLLGLLAGSLWLNSAQAAQLPSLFRTTKNNEQMERAQAAGQVPIDKIPAAYRDKVSQVLARPTIFTRGPEESFICQPEMYRHFLDHPDQATVAWQRLGAKCVEIRERGNGQFGWSDAQGSDVVWRVVYDAPNLRVWFAEGQVKPGPLFPMVPIQCVAVMKYEVIRPEQKGALMQHQADIFAYTDSKTATVVTRMLGPSIPRMAKQGATQMQMFFGAMAWYCHQHPDRVEGLLKPAPVQMPNFNQPYSPFDPTGMIYPDTVPSVLTGNE